MTFAEIAAGFRMVVASEEQELLRRVGEDGLKYADLSEREKQLADLMVSRGLLYRKQRGDDWILIASTINDIPRDRW